MARFCWDTQTLTPSPEPEPIDPNDPQQCFLRVLARLRESQPSYSVGPIPPRPAPTAWQLAGESLPGDTWDTIEERLDAIPRTPMACSCCEPLDAFKEMP